MVHPEREITLHARIGDLARRLAVVERQIQNLEHSVVKLMPPEPTPTKPARSGPVKFGEPL